MTRTELTRTLNDALAENKELRAKLDGAERDLEQQHDLNSKLAGDNRDLIQTGMRLKRERDEAQARLKRLAEATEVYDLWDCQREARTLLAKLNQPIKDDL